MSANLTFSSTLDDRLDGIFIAELSDQSVQANGLVGGKLFAKYGCQGCHQFQGSGGVLGPSLDGVITKKGLEYFVNKVRNPKASNPSSVMPALPLKDEEIEAIAGFLDS